MVQIVQYSTVSMNEWHHQHSNLVYRKFGSFLQSFPEFPIFLSPVIICLLPVFTSLVVWVNSLSSIHQPTTLFITGHTSSSPGQINDKQTTKRGHQRPEASQDYYWYWPPEVGPMSSVFLARNLDASVYFFH